ncbi:MAG: hypothetical protein NC102_05625 [Clostridium sp.]|nr:hypothetical protein [Clostridium sp.]
MMKKILTMALALSALFAAYAQDEASTEMVDKLYPQIMQASQSGDQALAKALIQRLVDAGEDISELEVTYAYSLAGTGELQKGIDRLNEYMRANPNDYLGCQALGDLYLQAGDKTMAMSWLGKCIDLNPGFARPYVTIARMTAKGDKKMSIASYNQAIRLFLDANQPNGAVQLGVEAMEVDPKNVELLMSLGDALAMAEMPDKAISFYNEGFQNAASAKEKDFQTITSANYKIAKLYAEKGEYDSALTYLSILIDNEKYTGEYADIYKEALNLAADCLDKKGDAAKAMQYRAKAKAMN